MIPQKSHIPKNEFWEASYRNSSFDFFCFAFPKTSKRKWMLFHIPFNYNAVSPPLKLDLFKGLPSCKSFWSSQVTKLKSLEIKFRSFWRKFTLSPNLLSWVPHSTSTSEKENKTSKLTLTIISTVNQQELNRAIQVTNWGPQETVLKILALRVSVFIMWE